MARERRLLRSLRADQQPKKLSQSQTARRAEMALFRYWQIENGEGPDPTSEERNAVAAALGVKVSDIAWPQMSQAVAS